MSAEILPLFPELSAERRRARPMHDRLGDPPPLKDARAWCSRMLEARDPVRKSGCYQNMIRCLLALGKGK